MATRAVRLCVDARPLAHGYPGSAETGPRCRRCKGATIRIAGWGCRTERCGNTRTTGNADGLAADIEMGGAGADRGELVLAQAGPGGRASRRGRGRRDDRHARGRPIPVTLLGRAIAFQQTSIRPQVGGEILEIAYDPGKPVRTGDLLFRLTPRRWPPPLPLPRPPSPGPKPARSRRRTPSPAIAGLRGRACPPWTAPMPRWR